MNVFDLAAKLSLDSSSYESGLSKAQGVAESFGSKVKSAIGTGLKVATAAIAASTTAVVAFAKSSLTTGEEFDSAMSQVAATMGTTVDQIGDLTDAAKLMGSTTSFTASEAAEGINNLAMAGISSADILAENSEGASLLSTTLSLAAAGAISMSDSATFLTGAIKGFGDEASNAAYYADMIATGASVANTDVYNLGAALSDASATASSYGQSADSVTLSLLRLAESNVTGTSASTALAAAMKNLYTPTDQAKEALDELGVAAYDASGDARDFNDIVDDLSGALEGYTSEQKNAYLDTIFGIQGLDAYNKMAAVSTDRVNELYTAIGDSSGSAAEMQATQLDNLEGKMTLLSSATDGLKLSFYDTFSSAATDAVGLATDYVNRLTEATDEGGIEGLLEELGSVAADATKEISQYIPKVISLAVQFLEAFAKGIINALPTINSSLAEVAGYLYDYLIDNAPAMISAGAENIANFITGISEHLPELLDSASELIGVLGQGIMDAIPTISSAASGLVQTLFDYIVENAPAMISAGIQTISSFVQGIAEKLPTLLANAATLVVTLVKGITEPGNIASMINAAIALIKGLAEGLIEAIPIIVEAVPEIIQNIFDGLSEAAEGTSWGDSLSSIGDSLSELWENISSVVGDVLETLGEAFGSIDWDTAIGIVLDRIAAALDIVSDAVEWFVTAMNDDSTTIGVIWEAIKTTISNAVDIINGVLSAISAFMSGDFSGAWESVQGVVSTAMSQIQTNVSTGISAAQTFMSTAGDAIKTLWNTTWDNLPEGVKTALTTITTTISTKINAAKTTLSTVLNAISSKFTSIFETVKSTVKNAIDKVKGMFNFSWSLPSIKLPHFSVSGGEAPWGFGGKGSLPSVSVSWYRKAMQQAMVLDGATIFGAAGASLLGGGEAGREVVSGEDHLLELINSSVSAALAQPVNQIAAILNQYLPECANSQVVIGAGAVDALTSKINKTLGTTYSGNRRGYA